MPSESILFVPLRSNASTLLAGAPVAAMRRRLKLASLYHDRVLLEGGILSLRYGPSGGASVMTWPTAGQPARWQTPRGRRRLEQQPFPWAMGKEDRPGVPATTMRAFVSSETTIGWVATLYPFADELPPGADWVSFVQPGSLPAHAGKLASRWTRADRHNSALEQALPVQFVRDAVIEHVNRDLAGAASEGVIVTIDSVHAEVVAQRFGDEEGWRLRGYVVPIVIPQAGDLPWEAIAGLRRDKNIARFRAVLREAEDEAAAEAAGGDIESAVHHACERHLADATGRLEGIGGPAKPATVGFVAGAAAGSATSGLAGLVGMVAGPALGAVPGAVLDLRTTIRRRRAHGWVGLYQQISEAA